MPFRKTKPLYGFEDGFPPTFSGITGEGDGSCQVSRLLLSGKRLGSLDEVSGLNGKKLLNELFSLFELFDRVSSVTRG